MITINSLSSFGVEIKLHSLLEFSSKEEELISESNINNTHLLWYGSKISNYSNILSNKFPQLNKEAPVRGTTFGRGIYFYDIVSKALCNCFPKNETAILLLCEVKMGNVKTVSKKDPFIEDTLFNDGYDSVKGIGQNTCLVLNSEDVQSLSININEKECVVPLGKSIVNTESTFLAFNEYVVYQPTSIKIKYAFVVKCLKIN